VGQEESVIADEEQRTITQVCAMLLHEGVEAHKKEGRQIRTALGRQTEDQDVVGCYSRFHVKNQSRSLLG
jgi:hypothetical protein